MEQKQAKARVNISDAILQPIQDDINNENDKKDNRNTNNHDARGSNSDFRRPKFISFSLLTREVILNDLENKKQYCC